MFSTNTDKVSFHPLGKVSLAWLKSTLLLMVGLCLVMTTNEVSASISPDDVYHDVLILERQIDRLRSATNNTQAIKLPPPQQYKKPVHVYAKTLEVRHKIDLLLKQFGLAELNTISIPSHEIQPYDVLDSVNDLIREMSVILQYQQIEEPQGRAVVIGYSSNEVYEKLWLVSNALDTFLGPITPPSVYEKISHAIVDITQLATLNNVTLPGVVDSLEGIAPKDVDIEGYRNLYRIKKIQRYLGIKTNPVASFPIGEITPGDVYDTLILIHAELSRIRASKNIPAPVYVSLVNNDKKPADVLALMQQFGQISELIISELKGK